MAISNQYILIKYALSMYSQKKMFKYNAYKPYKNVYYRNVFADDYSVIVNYYSSYTLRHSLSWSSY